MTRSAFAISCAGGSGVLNKTSQKLVERFFWRNPQLEKKMLSKQHEEQLKIFSNYLKPT